MNGSEKYSTMVPVLSLFANGAQVPKSRLLDETDDDVMKMLKGKTKLFRENFRKKINYKINVFVIIVI